MKKVIIPMLSVLAVLSVVVCGYFAIPVEARCNAKTEAVTPESVATPVPKITTPVPVVTVPLSVQDTNLAVASKNYDYLVTDIQRALGAVGYDIKVTGEYDDATKCGVEDYQKRMGLEVDGIVGPKTATALGIYLPDSILTPEEYNSDTDYLIIVSIKNRVATMYVKAYIDNTWGWAKAGTWACTVGKYDTPTPAGTFQIQSRMPGFWKNGLEYRYFTMFYGDYGFHSTGFDANGKTDTGVLGTAVSQGCIRLDEYVAQWIYENVPDGTTVVIK